MIGGRKWYGRNWKEHGIEFFIEGERVYRTNRFYTKPITDHNEVILIRELLYPIHSTLSYLINCI
jgi:hypothetical protein